MEPIINPWVFYFISTANVLKIIFLIISIILFGISCACILIAADSDDSEYYDKEELKRGYKKSKGKIVAAIFFLILGVLIPLKNTCYQMLVANYVTPNNLEVVKDNAKDIVDYIIEAADKISDKEEQYVLV